EKGHDVVVLTCSYSGQNEIKKGVIRIDDPGYNNNRTGIRWFKWFCRRILVELKNIFGTYSSIFDRWLENIVRSHDLIRIESSPDLIISTYPPVETLDAGIYLSKKFDIPLITDFRDGLIYDPIERKNIEKFKSVRSFYEKMESDALKYSENIISFSEPYTEYLKNKYKKDNVYTILNGYDEEDFASLPETILLKKRKLNIVFTGRIEFSYKYNTIDPFINAVRKIKENDKDLAYKIRFHFAGDLTTREKSSMNDLVSDGIFMLYGHVDRKDSLSIQRDADILLIFSQHDRPSAVPLKYFEYLYWKKPIIALTKNNFLEELMNLNRSGFCLNPEKEDEIYEFLSEYLSEPEKIFREYNPEDNIKKYSIYEQFKVLDKLI
ncbi:MAG: glycosyltransferase, partial [Candidatus Aminicenantes bacterium]|nr:glycosyltransferase [Candidatus Aminicenantes bacterium]